MTDRHGRPLTFRVHLALILLAFFSLGVLYSITVPLFEAPDEDGHYSYVKYMAEGRGVPAIPVDREGRFVPRTKRDVSRKADTVSRYVVNHPPLYYGLAGLATSWVKPGSLEEAVWYNPHFDYGVRGLRGNKNAVIHTQDEGFPYHGISLAVHISRWVSLLLGGGAVAATYLLALELFPRWRWLALGASAITAFDPQFLFISARVGNDAAVAGFCSLALLETVRFLKEPPSPQSGPDRRRQPVWLGTFLGLALLSKVSAVGMVPVVALAIVLKAIRRRSLSSFLLWGGMVFGVAMAIAGWWYLRNGLLYGDPLLWNVHLELVSPRVPTPSLGQLYREEFSGLEASLWAVFGWMNIPVHGWIYFVLRVLSRVAGLGLLWYAVRRGLLRFCLRRSWRVCAIARRLSASHAWRSRPEPVAPGGSDGGTGRDGAPQKSSSADLGLGLTVLWLIILFLSLLQFMRVQPGAQGRYLFPGISAISVLLFFGLSQWVPHWRLASWWERERVCSLLAGVVAGGFFLLALLCPLVYIAPAYAHPPILSPDQVPADLCRLDVNFSGLVALLGAKVGERPLYPGQKAEVTLCWRSLADMDRDYSVFLHLFGRGGERVGQLDIYPGVGSYPTSLWRAGDVICDNYEVPVSRRVATPVAARVEVGLYELDTMERLPASDGAGRSVGQVIVGRAKIVPLQWPSYDMEIPLDFTLGGAFALRGCALTPGEIHPGDTLRVRWYWEALEEGDKDYTVFVHLVDQEGRMWDQADTQPLGGDYPTSFWGRGEIIEDEYSLVLPPQAPPGVYRVEVGMYLLSTGERLPVRDTRGVRVPGDRIVVEIRGQGAGSGR